MSGTRTRVLVVCMVMLPLLAITLAAPTVAGPQKVPFGLNIPLSGPAAAWGLLVQNTYEIVIDMINKSGDFVVEGQQYEFELVPLDNGLDPP